MEIFTDAEMEYLREGRRLGRLATVGPEGMPHVTPVGWRLSDSGDEFVIGGIDVERTKKFRDVERTGRAAFVVDDVLPPWKPRGVEVRGTATAVRGPDSGIRLRPERVVSWGLESEELAARHARTISWGSSRA